MMTTAMMQYYAFADSGSGGRRTTLGRLHR